MKINAIDEVRNISFEKRKKDIAVSDNKDNIRSTNFPKLHLSIFLPKYQRKYLKLIEGLPAECQEMDKLVQEYARKYVVYKDNNLKTAQMTKDHYYIAFLDKLLQFAREVEKGEMSYENDSTGCSEFVAQSTLEWVWAKQNISKTIPIIEKEYKRVQKQLEEKSVKNGFVSSIMVNEDFMKDIDDWVSIVMNVQGVYDIENISAEESCFLAAMLTASSSKNYSYNRQIKNFFHELSMSSSTDSIDKREPVMPYYQDLATRVIKNADRNYNMQITYNVNDESAPEYFINSLVNQLQNLDNNDELKNIKKDNVKILLFNDHSDLDLISEELNKIDKNSDTQYFIIVKDFNQTFMNSLTQTESGALGISLSTIRDSIASKSKNIHFVLLDTQDNYYKLSEEPTIERTMRNYQTAQIPLMDSAALSEQVLATKDYIKSQINADIDDDALSYVSTLPIHSKGSGYDNVIRFIKNVASYQVDSEKITKDMVESYWENTQKDDFFTTDNPYEIVFDTGKNLDSIIGTPMVKKQAQKVVYELQNFPKTKGYIVYKDGAQSGVLNCAEAIAGELKIPMVCINAADFAMRDLDTVSQDPMKAIEVKMSKLLNTMRTQAQANPNKTVMLYISNFDHFSSNPIYGLSSIYEQQAFQKLLKEMKKTGDDGSYNIVVMGASDYPEATSDAIMHPGLFMDTIAIYPPETIDNIREIAQKHIEEKGYKFDDAEKTFSHFIKLMQSSNADYIDNIYILDKAYILAHKRGSETISIADINEAYLSSTAGEVPDNMLQTIHKEAIIRHEGGHALNLQFMYNLFKEKNDNLRIGDSIVNVVLDPRGWYGGCVYPSRSYENMGEVNIETVMSDIICDFGGNSSEEHFYNMDGSWGISQDRKIANDMAKRAVLYMGVGARMKHYIPDIDPQTGYPILTGSDEQDYVQDVKTILENAKIASDKINKCYENFLIEFSDKNISKYGTGDCVVTGDDFAKSLEEWEKRQSPKKKQEIARLKREILTIIEYTKKGIIYSGAKKFNPLYRMF